VRRRPQNAEGALSRRDFVRYALMSSAMVMSSRSPIGEAGAGEDANAVQYFGPLRALPPGAVRPSGWLRAYLEKQAAQLGSHLPEISWPFTQAYWGEQQEGEFLTQEQEYEAWWPWEQRAYWIDGATRLALILGDEQLLAKATNPIAYTLTHADMEGYLGPELFQDPLGDYHRWPHAVFFRSVRAVTAAGPDQPPNCRDHPAPLPVRHCVLRQAKTQRQQHRRHPLVLRANARSPSAGHGGEGVARVHAVLR